MLTSEQRQLDAKHMRRSWRDVVPVNRRLREDTSKSCSGQAEDHETTGNPVDEPIAIGRAIC